MMDAGTSEGTLRVLVTRPLAQGSDWVRRLGEAGVVAAALPLIGIAGPADAAPLQAAWAGLASRRLAMFVSANAVEHFFAARPHGAAWPQGLVAASPGPGTTRALQAAGVPAACIVAPAADAEQFDSEALWAALEARDWQGASLLFVRGEAGRDWLAQRLRERGATVEQLAAYRRVDPAWSDADARTLAAALQAPARHLWWFSSSEAIDRLEARVVGPWPASRALATHPRIAQRARRLGFGEVVEARADDAAVLAAIERSIQSPAL